MRLTILKLAAPALLLGLGACGPSSHAPEVATTAVSGSAVDPGNAGGNKLITVMTRNLYLGADLSPVIAAASAEAFVAAATGVWADVQANDFSVRAAAIAGEIAEAQPDLVGLQEAYLWRTQTPGDALFGGTTPAMDVEFDYVALVLAELADRGLEYRVATELTLFDFEAPTALGIDVRMTDRQVILARAGVQTARPRAATYSTLLSLPVLGQQVAVPRGWTSVDAKDQGAWVTFVNTHTEAFHPAVRGAQIVELEALLSSETGRVILVGDLNTQPDTDAAALLRAAGFADAWAALRADEAGLTCCWPELLAETEPPLSERIDYVLFRGAISPRAVEIVGEELEDRVGGLWPSDHAGVVATLRLENPRFFPAPR
jgi:endonuclease/exonuclease/phosphatase family metal-dependent hydrolase